MIRQLQPEPPAWPCTSSPWRPVLEALGAPTPVLGDQSPGAPLARDTKVAQLELSLAADTLTALEQTRRACGVDWETVIHAAWAFVLSRHQREAMVWFGTLPLGTEFPRPLALSLPWQQTIADYLANTQRVAREQAQWPAPAEAIAASWQLPSGSPAFNSIIRHEPAVGAAQRGLAAPVVLTAARNEARLQLAYATCRFQEATAWRLLDHWARALRVLSGDGGRSLASVALSDDADRAAYTALNATATEFGPDETLVSLFEACVERYPEAAAVVADSESLTYRQLDRRANQLARGLLELGAGADVPVAICAERSVDMVVGLLAILKSGSAYLPMDPSYPADRLQQMLEDAQSPILLVHRATAACVPAARVTRVAIDDRKRWDRYPDGAPHSTVEPKQLAYVIYTSGSTGNPKGVMNEHAAVVNRLKWAQAAFSMQPDDRVLQKTPFSFDVSVWEFFWTLMVGARLVIARPEGHKDSGYLIDLIQQHAVTFVHFVPSMLQAFLLNQRASDCRSLKHIICSGEELPAPVASECMERLPARLYNLYGPTEAAVDVTAWTCERDSRRAIVPIGRPIANTQIYVLDEHGHLCPPGVPGELHIGGIQVARGYLRRPDLTREKFIPDPFGPAGARLYKSGDLARLAPDGVIEYLGRIDFQVKLRGLRIELGEIEAALLARFSLERAAVLLREDRKRDARLVAYLVARSGERPSDDALRAALGRTLPEFMLPSAFVWLESLPLTPSGKLNRKALPAPPATSIEPGEVIEHRSERERSICRVLAEVLGFDEIAPTAHFFEIGGNSLLAMKAVAQLRDRLDVDIPIARFFQHSTPRSLDSYLSDRAGETRMKRRLSKTSARSGRDADAVAVIGMAGRFPGAPSVNALWEVVRQGLSTISEFAASELDPSVSPELAADANYVRARGIAPDYDRFDPTFFGMSPREAELMDPQQRILLETAWHALEHAGYVPETLDGLVGVFAGQYSNTYLTRHVLTHPEIIESLGELGILVLNEKDYAATRIAHQLNLFGPAVSIHTACSTSLVAVVEAVFSLRSGRCDVALAGGASVTCPVKSGYLYVEGGMLSADGQTRSFDAAATGTTFNDGAAMVVLKRLSDALRDRDTIYGVIRGAATNNDGGNKASFTAPSVEGQAAVITLAQRMAGVSPRDIGYIEAHGTATPLGDPIEVEALTAAFRQGTRERAFCALGSVKSNIGHLVCAAGVTGLIKALHVVKDGVLPPTAHFQKPNPNLRLEQTPFFVTGELQRWNGDPGRPRVAGVSSFGVGGTNAHVIVEEPPATRSLPSPRPCQLLLCSAKSEAALERSAEQLSQHLQSPADLELADVAFTLARGRAAFAHRCFAVGSSTRELSEALAQVRPRRVTAPQPPRLAFLFPGQGAQFAGMGRALYDLDAVFRAVVDDCCEQLEPLLDCDLRQCLFEADAEGRHDEQLRQTSFTQPALFTIEFAMAQVLLGWGLSPAAMIGHSVGEFVCAVLAGVMSLGDALHLVAARGRLIQSLPPGAMLSVRMNADAIRPMLTPELAVASENSPSLCVISGPEAAITDFERELTRRDVISRRLVTSHAFHSPMMDAVVEPFAQLVRRVRLQAPRLPFVSTVTGDWIQAHEATDPMYWARHLRASVVFSRSIQRLMEDDYAFVESGPRATLTTLSRQQCASPSQLLAVPTLGDSPEVGATWRSLMSSLGQLWTAGVEVDWENFYASEERRRVGLPTYPFERVRCWLEPGEAATETPRRADDPRGNGHPRASTPDTEALIQRQLEVIQQQVDMLRRLQGS